MGELFPISTDPPCTHSMKEYVDMGGGEWNKRCRACRKHLGFVSYDERIDEIESRPEYGAKYEAEERYQKDDMYEYDNRYERKCNNDEMDRD